MNNSIRLGETFQLSYRDNPQITNQQIYGSNEIFSTLTTDPIWSVYDIKGGWAGLVPSRWLQQSDSLAQYRKGQQQ